MSLAALSVQDLSALVAAQQRIAIASTRPAERARLLTASAEEVSLLLRVEHVSLNLIDPKDPGVIRVLAGTGALARHEGELLPVEGSLEGRSLETGETLRTEDLSSDPRAYRARERGVRVGPCLVAPLSLSGHRIGAVVAAREPQGAPFLERDAQLLGAFATSLAAAFEAAERFEDARGSRAELDAWRRERALGTWMRRYEELEAREGRAVFAWDMDQNWMEWSGGVVSLLGASPQEFTGPLEQWLERLDADDVLTIREAMERAAQEGDHLHEEVALRDRAGDCLTFILRGEKAEDAPVVIGTLERAEQYSRVDTGAGVAELGPSTADIVQALRHEINNPLAAVIGQAQILKGEPAVQDNAMLKQSIETVLREGERIANLVKRISAAKGPLRINPLGGIEFPGEVGS